MTKIVRNSILQTEVESSYNTLISGGKINTYGSPERLHKGVVSQTLQMDEQTAKQLVEIINREYKLSF